MTGNVYEDTFLYVQMISAVFLLLGGLAIADIIITMIIKIVKQAKINKLIG